MREGVLFLNPRAGSFPATEAEELREAARAANLEVIDIVPDVDVAQKAREAVSAGRKTVVVCGGDGSINHVAQALVGTDGILGIIPLGTLNHLAHDLNLPFDWREALTVATRGEITQIDTGRINGKTFLNTAMVGLYPTISHYRERFRSTHSKWLAYLKAGRLALRRFHSVSLIVEVDGRLETIRTQMFAVLVNSYDLARGGLLLPRTTFTDGRITLFTATRMTRMQMVIAFAKYLRGKVADVAGFRTVRASRLRIDTARHRLHVAVDGELSYFELPLVIEAVPASLLIRVPRREAAPI